MASEENANALDFDEQITFILQPFVESNADVDAATDKKVRRLSLLRMLSLDSRSGHFWEPVENLIPGYNKIIKAPMDLNQVAQRALDDGYASDKDFFDQVQLVWANSKLFNARETVYYKHAQACSDKFVKFFEQWITSADRPVDPGGCV